MGQPRARDFVRKPVTARLHDRAAAVRARLEGEDFAVVVDDKDIVLGLVRAAAVAGTTDRTAAEVMGSPRTIRPHLTAEAAREYLRHAPVLVTTSDGKLVGALNSEELERASRNR